MYFANISFSICFRFDGDEETTAVYEALTETDSLMKLTTSRHFWVKCLPTDLLDASPN